MVTSLPFVLNRLPVARLLLMVIAAVKETGHSVSVGTVVRFHGTFTSVTVIQNNNCYCHWIQWTVTSVRVIKGYSSYSHWIQRTVTSVTVIQKCWASLWSVSFPR